MKQTERIAACDGRLDVLVAQTCGITRSQAARWIAAGLCGVNGKTLCKAGAAVHEGDALSIREPDVAETTVLKEDIPLRFLYQDEDIAVVDKPCGMVVHPAAGNETGTLVNALLFALPDLSGIGGVRRPGIVHRLDKDTSGVMLVAKNDAAHVALSAQLKNRTMEKHYLAVVEGGLKEECGLIDRPIGRSPQDRKRMAVIPDGRSARTEWARLEALHGATLVDVHLLTGRTHQIRVHMHSIGHPVAGDPIYGLKRGVAVPRLMLHAHTLCFTHPRTGERLRFEAPIPEDFMQALLKLRLDAAAPLPLK
ncbi:MAG: RluA family pseudouridine synthase [Eubacteriales bacterium]|nr:RluA family pseudouridine synthase [Eubacteriales bacterium]